MTRLLDEIDANELEKWIDSSPPLSDDEMNAMSAYFHSESFQYEDYLKDNKYK